MHRRPRDGCGKCPFPGRDAAGAVATPLDAVIGFAIPTWSQTRLAQTNATAIFLGLLFFGWLWGPWGVFLGAPLVGICKLVFERIDPLRPVAVFLSR